MTKKLKQEIIDLLNEILDGGIDPELSDKIGDILSELND